MNVENGMIQISISNRSLERTVSDLRSVQRQFPQAVARAVNRTMDGMRTDAVQETAKRYFIKASEIRAEKGKKYFSFRKATPGNIMGAMIVKGKRRSLADYQLTPNTPKAGKKVALKGAVKREGDLKPLGPAFLVKRKGGRYFPFFRIESGAGAVSQEGKRYRYKGLKSLISPSMPQIIKNEETVQAIEQGAQERFTKRIEHEISLILDKLTI